MSITTAAPTAASTPVSSAQSNIDAGQKNLDTSYDTFLKMLTTQLQHQDPTSPMDPNQFTQQLVQMTGVQQALLTNSLLKQLVTGSTSSGLSQAVSLIGGKVSANTDTAALSGGQASWNYDLGSTAKEAIASIATPTGQVIWSGPLSDLSAGSHSFTWNGRDSLNRQLADGGKYTLTIAAKDAADAAVKSTTSIEGVAKSVRQSNGQILVSVGATEVPLSSITKVSMQ
jgi:flagellar basal-body rod modification protein FlgD